MTTQTVVGKRAKVLIVDDDPAILSQLQLALEEDFDVHVSSEQVEAWNFIQSEHPDVVTLDLALEHNDPETGFTLLQKCQAFDPLLKVVMITGNDEEENALRAVSQGAFDFFPKPIDLRSLRVLMQRAATIRRLEDKGRDHSQDSEDVRLGSLLGKSQEMHAVFRLIRKVAPTDFTVSILGESGTGKEVVAKEIHRLSQRASMPFVSINCAAIPEALLESELFGHEKGSFTGAHASREGRLEVADGGTVFLDEVGEIPIPLQAKLLRFLQEREIERVGGRRIIPLDVRVLAATHRDLGEEVKQGRFREDLFYRLSVVNLTLPPLHKRVNDVLLLAEHFLRRYSAELNRPKLTFSREAKQAMLTHHWPGNVRELEHRIQRASLMSSGKSILSSDLELSTAGLNQSLSLKETKEQAIEEAILGALRRAQGNISKAATDLKISRPTLHDHIRRIGLDAKAFKTGSQHDNEALS